VVNVTGIGFYPTGRNLFFNGSDLSGADNVRLPNARHMTLPRQEETYQALVNGMQSAPPVRSWPSHAATTSNGMPGRIVTGAEARPQPNTGIGIQSISASRRW
jgi:hypothetical protein